MFFKIGELCIEWTDSNYKFNIDRKTSLFKIDETVAAEMEDHVQYLTEKTDLTSAQEHIMLKYSSSNELYETDYGRMMIFHWARCRFAVGYHIANLDHEKIICYIHKDIDKQPIINASWFFNIAGLHRLFLRRGAAVLHASYIEWNKKAIIFTAPSQIGKSTQSQLWEKNENAIIVNDDRVLLGKKDDIWRAYGYPACGSSNICLNVAVPVGVIVVLEQGDESVIRTLTFAEKVKALVLGIEVYRWELSEIDMSIKLAEKMAKEIDVIKLICKPDDSAVHVLKKYLLERGW